MVRGFSVEDAFLLMPISAQKAAGTNNERRVQKRTVVMNNRQHGEPPFVDIDAVGDLQVQCRSMVVFKAIRFVNVLF